MYKGAKLRRKLFLLLLLLLRVFPGGNETARCGGSTAHDEEGSEETERTSERAGGRSAPLIGLASRSLVGPSLLRPFLCADDGWKPLEK